MDEHNTPTRTPVNPLSERILRWVSGSESGHRKLNGVPVRSLKRCLHVEQRNMQ